MSLRKKASIRATLLGTGLGAGVGSLAAGEGNRGKGAIVGGVLGGGGTYKGLQNVQNMLQDTKLNAAIYQMPKEFMSVSESVGDAKNLDEAVQNASKVRQKFLESLTQQQLDDALAATPELQDQAAMLNIGAKSAPVTNALIGGGLGGLGTRLISKKKDDEQKKEAAAKPDFPDVDGDGDKTEPISKAQKDKKAKKGKHKKEASVAQLSALASMIEQGHFGKEAQYAFEGMSQAIESYVQEDLTEKTASVAETDYNIYDENAARKARLDNLLRKL